jgi:ElaB/YqjD/DUF883 family membrane-anchored ribosome-binding protein
MSDMTKEDVRDRLGNIDQIRDIIFGAQLRDYDNRLMQIESDFVVLQQDVRDRVEQMRTSLTNEFKLAVDAIEKKLKVVNTNAQEEASELRQQIDRLQRKLAGNVQTLDECLDTQVNALRNDLNSARDAMQTDVNALRDIVLEELDRRSSQLQGNKVSKDDMAEVLFELGMRLKGNEFIPQLRDLSGKEGQDSVPLLQTRKLKNELVAH